MNETIIDRKHFLKKLGLGILSAPFILEACQNSTITPDTGSTVAPAGDCTATTASATEGPYYVTNVAESVNINDQRLPGIPMKITGIVNGSDKKPLKGAKVEIWHADSSGAYHPQGNGDVSKYPASQVTLRGFTITNDKGEFAFNSIKTGLYTGRRRHIHWRISAAGQKDITTQTYWLSEKGDAREQADGTDANADICRYIDFKDNGSSGITGNVVFNL